MSNLLISSIIAFMENGYVKSIPLHFYSFSNQKIPQLISVFRNPSTSEVEWEPIPKNGVMNCLVIYSYTYQRMEDIENHENNKFWKELDACERPQ